MPRGTSRGEPGAAATPRGSGHSDFVVVANRLPIDMEVLPDGSLAWKRSPGGLVTALEPLLRKQRGAWIGWPGIVDGPEDPITRSEERRVGKECRL